MDLKCQYSKMEIPIDSEYADIAGNYAGSVAKKFGFDEDDVREIAHAASQAVSWAIGYSFDENDKGVMEISCEIVPEGFKIAIRDKGLPFEPPKTEASESLSDIFSLKKVVDEISFNNLGPQGKEIVLVKYTGQNRITDYYKVCELDLYEKPSAKTPTPDTDTDFVIRPMKPEEAIEVSKCIYKGYGYSYLDDHVYYPAKLRELNAKGILHSVVAANKANEIAGHNALYRENPDDSVVEMAYGVVKPEFRSRGCLKKLSEYLIEKAKADNLKGLFLEAVTLHVYSQQVASLYGIRACGLLLGYIPATQDFKGLEKIRSERVSVVVCYLDFGRSFPSEIHPPGKHQKMITRLYEHLGMPFDIPPASFERAEGTESAIQIKILNSMSYARIKVDKIGSRLVDDLTKRLRELCLKKIEVINLFLDLSDPSAGYYSEKIEELGFFFAGILPGFMKHGKDAVIFQYLNNVTICYDEIKVHSDMAKELVRYVKNRDPNLT